MAREGFPFTITLLSSGTGAGVVLVLARSRFISSSFCWKVFSALEPSGRGGDGFLALGFRGLGPPGAGGGGPGAIQEVYTGLNAQTLDSLVLVNSKF